MPLTPEGNKPSGKRQAKGTAMNRNLNPEQMDEQLAAYDCLLATCEHLTRKDGRDYCALNLPCGDPDHCKSFCPRHLVRLAQRDDGSFYCSRTEMREYLDVTIDWFARMSVAKQEMAALEREESPASA